MERKWSTASLARRGYHRDLYEPDFLPSEASEEKVKGSMSGDWGGINAAWASIARTYAADYATLLLLVVILVVSEASTPFERFIYTADSNEYWRYSYPLHISNTVPSWSVPLLALLVPIGVFAAYYIIMRPSRLEFHNTVLACWHAVIVTAVITNLVKLGVGRPRPSFMARCFPGGMKPVFDEGGYAKCSPNAIDPAEGRKSFPSGHTSWSTSGMGFLTLWLVGKLRCFDGSMHPSRFVLALLPLGFAVWVGITRLQDYWHHWEDVCAGFVLGISMAYIFYRQQFPALTDARAGYPLQSQLDSGGAPRQSVMDLEASIMRNTDASIPDQ